MDLDSIVTFLRSFWVVWLMLLFLGIVAYALWPRNRAKFEEASRIPFKEGEDQEK